MKYLKPFAVFEAEHLSPEDISNTIRRQCAPLPIPHQLQPNFVPSDEKKDELPSETYHKSRGEKVTLIQDIPDWFKQEAEKRRKDEEMENNKRLKNISTSNSDPQFFN